MSRKKTPKTDVAEIRALIKRWAKAVRDQNIDGVLAHHSKQILMFDVPPPLESKGLQAYRETWDLFYSSQPRPIAFDIQRMKIVAGKEVAFVTALMQCDGTRTKFDFRLTMGLRKIKGQWVILHEHHSVPAA